MDELLEKYPIPNLNISTFGYGEDHDPESLQKIAQSKKGNFYFINDLSRVDEAFVDCLALLTSVIGGRARATVRLIPTPLFKEISFKNCFGISWQGDMDTSRELDIGNVYIGMEKSFVAEIELQADSKFLDSNKRQIKIGEIELELHGIGNDSKTVKLHKDLVVEIITPDQAATIVITRDEEVEKHYLRVTGAQVLTAAKDLLNKGNYLDAEKAFSAFRSRLGKVNTLDLVLENLNKQIQQGQNYFENRLSSKFANNMDYKETKHFTHCLNQQAQAMMCEQSAPEWNRNLYQNKRQERFVNELYSKKCK